MKQLFAKCMFTSCLAEQLKAYKHLDTHNAIPGPYFHGEYEFATKTCIRSFVYLQSARFCFFSDIARPLSNSRGCLCLPSRPPLDARSECALVSAHVQLQPREFDRWRAMLEKKQNHADCK